MMDTIKGRLEKRKYEERPLNDMIVSMSENRHGVLTIVLKGDQNIRIGDKIHFRRIVASELYMSNIIAGEHIATVERCFKEDGNTTIKILAPPKVSAFVDHAEETENGLKVYFGEDLNLFPQDIVTGKISATVNTASSSGESTSFSLVEDISDTHVEDTPVSPEDMLIRRKLETDILCDYASGYTETQEYYYLPYRYVRNAIFIPNGYSGADVVKSNGCKFEFSQNEYYYMEPLQDDQVSGACTNWSDYNEKVFMDEGEDGRQSEYVDVENVRNRVVIAQETNYWQVPLGLSENTDSVHLFQEHLINDLFYRKVKASVIPEHINMEKIKFQPAIKVSDDEFIDVSEITYNLHFRRREGPEWEYVEDGDIWNGGISGYDAISGSENLGKSDLLGFLGFTDNDVKYQKMNVQKTFLRMSYYDSNDFITKSMLGYSTIFLDGGELFGKYLKVRSLAMKSGISVEDPGNPSVCITADDFDVRVDSRFTIMDEYHYDKSSEGFNIYYFAADAKEIENSGKTIYMQVDFNHAKYGRTIPMIVPPSDRLTMSNYQAHLYIPIILDYINGKYCYYVEGDGKLIVNDMENGTVTFNLFEPILTK